MIYLLFGVVILLSIIADNWLSGRGDIRGGETGLHIQIR